MAKIIFYSYEIHKYIYNEKANKLYAFYRIETHTPEKQRFLPYKFLFTISPLSPFALSTLHKKKNAYITFATKTPTNLKANTSFARRGSGGRTPKMKIGKRRKKKNSSNHLHLIKLSGFRCVEWWPAHPLFSVHPSSGGPSSVCVHTDRLHPSLIPCLRQKRKQKNKKSRRL